MDREENVDLLSGFITLFNVSNAFQSTRIVTITYMVSYIITAEKLAECHGCRGGYTDYLNATAMKA